MASGQMTGGLMTSARISSLSMKLLRRDFASGELRILAFALTLAVTLVTSVALFVDRLHGGIVNESGRFLAADRVLQSPLPVDMHWLEMAQSLSLRQAQTLSFQTMVMVGDNMQLASVKAVNDAYPLKGDLSISQIAFEAATKVTHGPARGTIWIDARLLPLLGVNVGDSVQVGETRLRIDAVLVSEPDRGANMFSFGPRVLMHLDDVAATAVIQPGSRVEYKYLFAGEPAALNEFSTWLQPLLTSSQRLVDLAENQPTVAQSLERAQRFLLLGGALGVALAGVAVALSAQRYAERHWDYVALFKSFGATSQVINAIYLQQMLLLAAATTVVGCIIGIGIQAGFMQLLGAFISITPPPMTWQPLLLAAVTDVVCLLAFAYPSIHALKRVTPMRVLRRDLDSSVSRTLGVIVGALAMFGLMWIYSRSLILTLAVAAGIGCAVLLLGVIAFVLLRLLRNVPLRAGTAWQLALATLWRHARGNSGQILVFALCILLLLMMTTVRTALLEDWRQQLPAGTPNYFLINVAPAEVASISQTLKSEGIEPQGLYPMVRGRLTHINDQLVRERVSKETRERAGIERELNLTWTDQLPADNRIVTGSWWSQAESRPMVSVESKLAERLGIGMGDELRFVVGGMQIDARVASIRELQWDRMRPNFYMIFPPQMLRDYPATYITSFYLPAEKKALLTQLVRSYPTVTLLEMESIIAQVRAIVDQVSLAIEVVLGLILIAGLLVLFASVQATVDDRKREAALLRALGARNRLLAGSLLIEFAVLGALAGLLAAAGSELSVYLLQTLLFGMRSQWHGELWLIGPFAGCVIVTLAGWMSTRRVLDTPPIEVLREVS
jgi:putative ABC transport system permease protein